MTTEVTIALISSLAAIIAAISKTDIFSRKHYALRKDIELLKSLPDNSDQRDVLAKFIDRRISEYITKSTRHQRNTTEVAIGVIFLPPGAYLSWWFYSAGGWWLTGLLLSGFMVILGVYGIASGLRKVERDDKGNAVKK